MLAYFWSTVSYIEKAINGCLEARKFYKELNIIDNIFTYMIP